MGSTGLPKAGLPAIPKSPDMRWRARIIPIMLCFLARLCLRRIHDGARPAILINELGIALRHGATSAQRAMLGCLSDMLARLPRDWTPQPIGAAAEADLLDWDAEKYRQALAARL